MSDFPSPLVLPDPLVTITLSSMCSLGAVAYPAIASAAWPTANKALFIPFKLTRPITATQMFVYNGTTAQDNFDLGIYSVDGTRLVSAGATVQANASVIQVVNITDTLLGPGLFYMACAFEGTTSTVIRTTLTASKGKIAGITEMANAYPLPAVATFATLTTSVLPIIGLTTRSVV